MKPSKETAFPHADLFEGPFLRYEFAAHITAVHTSKATQEYQNTAALVILHAY